MSIMAITVAIIDNGGRRSGIERRQFSYTNHIPELRSFKDRRTGVDQRSGLDRRTGKVIEFISREDKRKRNDRRTCRDRRAAFAAAL